MGMVYVLAIFHDRFGGRHVSRFHPVTPLVHLVRDHVVPHIPWLKASWILSFKKIEVELKEKSVLQQLVPMKRMKSETGIERVSATEEKGECNKVFNTRVSTTKYLKLG